MHRTLLAAVTLAFSSNLALAADIPVPAPIMAPVASWTGFYAGLNGGYTWGHQSVDPLVTSEACDNPLGCPQILALLSTGRKISPNGFTGGLQLGYNHQYGNVLFGLESDIDYLRLKGSFAYGPTQPSPQPITGAGTGWLPFVHASVGWLIACSSMSRAASRLPTNATGKQA
jgi:outer membrane immunogenic protein